MLTWLLSPLGRLLGGTLALFLIVGLIYAKGVGDGKAKLSPKLAKAVAERNAYDLALKATRAAYDKSEALRSQEKAEADKALSESRKACSRDLEAVRTQEEQFRRLFTRPVRLKDGCPLREVWKAEDLGLKP